MVWSMVQCAERLDGFVGQLEAEGNGATAAGLAASARATPASVMLLLYATSRCCSPRPRRDRLELAVARVDPPQHQLLQQAPVGADGARRHQVHRDAAEVELGQRRLAPHQAPDPKRRQRPRVAHVARSFGATRR